MIRRILQAILGLSLLAGVAMAQPYATVQCQLGDSVYSFGAELGSVQAVSGSIRFQKLNSSTVVQVNAECFAMIGETDPPGGAMTERMVCWQNDSDPYADYWYFGYVDSVVFSSGSVRFRDPQTGKVYLSTALCMHLDYDGNGTELSK